MGVVTVSSSASRTLLDLSATFSSHRSPLRRTLVLAFKINKTKNTTLAAAHKPVPIPVDAPKEHQKRPRGARKSSKRVKAVSSDEALPSTLEVDYNEAAAKLENIYKLSPTTDPFDVEYIDCPVRRGRRRRGKSVVEGDDIAENKIVNKVVRNSHKKLKRLSLDMRIALRKSKESKLVLKRKGTETEEDRINLLVREYSFSSRSGSDWKRMKILPVLPSSEHSWLFKLMQPMKALLEVKENLQHVLGQEPTHGDLAEATKRTVVQVRNDLLVGRAARNKLIKHNLRLVLFAFKKYFQEFANGPTFEDLCQAGVKGLITAIDRFEPKRRFRLSTYALFWIRHFIVRSMTLSSFIRVPFGFESVRMEIQRAKLELSFQLQRPPTEEEIVKKVGISPNRYHDVMRASRPIASLHARHPVTQEELIDRIVDTDSVGSDKWRQPALVRLALDDVLDSLMPKESLVIRQRYGLDGRGNRSLGEIAGNLNLSREMVRKYEMKALMKLKHPARVDYLRRYFFLKDI